MDKYSAVVIRNIYYMLSYAYKVLKQGNYEQIAAEEFDNVVDLLAAILDKALSQQLKQGLYREYIPVYEDILTLRGKMDMQGTFRHQMQRKQLLACEHDELSENNIFNKIIKATAIALIHSEKVATKNKVALKKEMLFFHAVDNIVPQSIPWQYLQFRRNNLTYIMLMNICYFILNELLLSQDKGTYKMRSFEEQLPWLFQNFVCNYYAFHYPYLSPQAREVEWALDEPVCDEFLPKMKTDISLEDKENDKILIIDTKFYSHMMQENFDKKTYHSDNMYQIFSYVKNKDYGHKGNVSGMLLYAKTESGVAPNGDYLMSGNRISVKALDLNMEFEKIAQQMDKIVDNWLGNLVATGINRI
jgi:5-methylcytosine-specific restriction enzyme subunit McrC